MTSRADPQCSRHQRLLRLNEMAGVNQAFPHAQSLDTTHRSSRVTRSHSRSEKWVQRPPDSTFHIQTFT